MNCPKCNAEMIPAELEQISGNAVFESWQCPVCGFRKEIKREKRKTFPKINY